MDVRERVAKRMRLIVGLGNRGPEYAWTPHNLGFLVVDRLAELGGMRVERPEGKACIGRGHLAGQEVLLAKPQTYVNLSGLAVRELLSRFECDPAEMIVIYDRSEEHTSELQSRLHLVCRLLLEKKKKAHPAVNDL